MPTLPPRNTHTSAFSPAAVGQRSLFETIATADLVHLIAVSSAPGALQPVASPESRLRLFEQ